MSSDELVSVVLAWQPRVRAFFARRCREHDDVDDLVQEALASIIRCYHTFSHRSTLSTWVYAVCRNVLSNHIYYRDRDCRLIKQISARLRRPEGTVKYQLHGLRQRVKRLLDV